MASKSVCDICLRRDKTSVAIKFCSDCEDKLCTECADVHGMFKALVSHHVIDINLATDQSFEIKKFCIKHAEMILEIYCSDHDVLCCRSCMTDGHRTCGKLLPLEVAAKNVRKSVIFGDITTDVEQLNKTADRLADVKGEFGSILDGSKVDVQKKKSDLKEKLMERVKQLESRCQSEVDTVYAKLSSKVQDNEKNVESRIGAIQDISRRFDLVTKYGSESQIFLLLNYIKSDINKTSEDLESFIPTLKCPAIGFEEGDLGHLMTSLGLVTEKDNPCNIEYRPPRNQQAQIIQMRDHTPTKFQLEEKVSLNRCRITDVSVTRDNRIILCQNSNNNLLVLTDKGQQLQKIILSGSPWGIAIPSDSDEAWITLPRCKYVQVVDTKSNIATRQVMVQSSEYYGIAVVGDNIALGNRGKVDVIDKNGILLKSLKIGEMNLYSLCAARNNTNKLYCCETDRRNLHCINMDGTVVFTVSSLTGPIGVITDGHGNLYVFDHNTNELHRFSEDGKPMDIILTKKDGLNSPYSGVFYKNFTKMFVSNYADGNMFIFSCKYIF